MVSTPPFTFASIMLRTRTLSILSSPCILAKRPAVEDHPMKSFALSWPFWALLSAGFAALTAIFAKVGVEAVNPNLATFIRTVIVVAAAGVMVFVTRSWQAPSSISANSWLFLVLSGLATGASWFCYFRALKLGDAARVAPIDKLSVVFVAVFAVLFLGEKLAMANLVGIGLVATGALLLALP